MKSAMFAEWKAAFFAEARKIYALKTHVTVLAITLSLLLVILIGEFALSAYAAQQMKTKAPVNLATIWKIFQVCAQYINPLVLSLIVSAQVGKEFEWKTFHQIQLKGQTPAVYVLSKLATFFSLAIGTYLLQFVIVTVFYGIRALIESQPFDMPVAQVAIDPLNSLLAISIGLLMAVLTTSASVGIVLTLVYLVVLELILFPLFGSLMGMVNQHSVATALSYAPMKLPGQFAAAEGVGEATIILAAIIALLAGLSYLSYLVLNRRQIGLIR